MRKLIGVLKVPPFVLRLLPPELRTLAAAEPSVLSGMLDIALGVPESALVGPLPRGDKSAKMIRTPALAIVDAEAWLERDKEGRHRCLRHALAVLAEEHDAGRLLVSQGQYPGGVYTADRLSVAPGSWVQRAVWRDKQNNARAGNRPGHPLFAGEVDMPGGGRDQLWELWQDGELTTVVAAPDVYYATFSMNEYPPQTLWHREDLRRAQKAEKAE